MTAILDVAIGLVFVYLVLGLLASAIAETLEHYLRYRADYLTQGIEKLLLGGSADLRKRLYEHPLIKSLYTPSRIEKLGRAGGPAYIPSRQFVLALLDMATTSPQHPAGAGAAAATGGGSATAAGGATSAAPTVAQMLSAIAANEQSNVIPSSLATALRALVADAGDDVNKVKANIQEWFDGSMDRVAGWYKRRAQFVLLLIGATLAVGVNVDTLAIVHTLSNDAAVRSAVVAAAETYARENPRQDAPGSPQSSETIENDVKEVTSQLAELGLPVGWRFYDPAVDDGIEAPKKRHHLIEQRVWPRLSSSWPADWRSQAGSHLLGWILTAFAVSFGAPFWFDLLNKIMVVRSTVKPREKSHEEGSKDR
jgi:hypothetical protein